MARKDRFRQERLYNVKIALVFLLFVAIVVSGLLAVDYNRNAMINSAVQFEIFTITPINNDIYQITILNNRFDLDFRYMMRDYKRFKSTVSGVWDKIF